MIPSRRQPRDVLHEFWGDILKNGDYRGKYEARKVFHLPYRPRLKTIIRGSSRRLIIEKQPTVAARRGARISLVPSNGHRPEGLRSIIVSSLKEIKILPQ